MPVGPRPKITVDSKRRGCSCRQAATDILITELVKTGKFIVVERDKMNKLMEEQKQRAREAGKKNKQVVSVSEIETKARASAAG